MKLRYTAARWCRLLPVLLALLLAACAAAPPAPPVAVEAPAPAAETTIALLGATGMVGGFLLREALERGHQVRALARTPSKLDEYRDRIVIVQGDARDPDVVRALLRGADVVISALGPVRADGDAARFISTTVSGQVLQAMEQEGVDRYLVVSGGAVVMPGDSRNLLGWWIRLLVQMGLRSTLQDKQAEYELLAASAADWTLLRCPLIDAEPWRSEVLVSLQTPPAFRLRAGELARFALDHLGGGQFSRRGPFLGSSAE